MTENTLLIYDEDCLDLFCLNPRQNNADFDFFMFCEQIKFHYKVSNKEGSFIDQ